MNDYLHVAVGVVRRANGKVLLARRRADVHQGGLWEFPGGKVEAHETVEQALERELLEELAIRPRSSRPLIKVRHHYPDLSVLLDVWEVLDYQGQVQGNEGQPIAWVEPDQLGGDDFPLPAPNTPIVKAIQLPDQLLITGDFADPDDLLRKLQNALERGLRLVQLRSLGDFNKLNPTEGLELAKHALALCQQFNASLVLNSGLGFTLEGAGLHLSASMARHHSQRPEVQGLLGVSCHSRQELAHAERLNPDYVLLSPVTPTQSHPEAEALGWEAFEELAAAINCPVYALGGMSAADLGEARRRGAQGVAAISAFWGD